MCLFCLYLSASLVASSVGYLKVILNYCCWRFPYFIIGNPCVCDKSVIHIIFIKEKIKTKEKIEDLNHGGYIKKDLGNDVWSMGK